MGCLSSPAIPLAADRSAFFLQPGYGSEDSVLSVSIRALQRVGGHRKSDLPLLFNDFVLVHVFPTSCEKSIVLDTSFFEPVTFFFLILRNGPLPACVAFFS